MNQTKQLPDFEGGFGGECMSLEKGVYAVVLFDAEVHGLDEAQKDGL